MKYIDIKYNTEFYLGKEWYILPKNAVYLYCLSIFIFTIIHILQIKFNNSKNISIYDIIFHCLFIISTIFLLIYHYYYSNFWEAFIAVFLCFIVAVVIFFFLF